MRTSVEDIVYVLALFAFVCLCICIYNIYILYRRWTTTKRNMRIEEEIRQIIGRSLQHMTLGEGEEEQDMVHLGRILRSSDALIVFTNVFESMRVAGVHGIEQIPLLYLEILNSLTVLYRNRSASERIFLAHAYAVFGVKSPELIAFMFQCLRSHNLYLRIQALKTLTVFGEVKAVVDAIKMLDEGEVAFSNKLISDMLEGFRGDGEMLDKSIFDRLNTFSVPIQVAFINNIAARKSDHLSGQLAKLLQNDRINMEVQIALLKYFREVYTEEALSPILNMTQSPSWECIAIAAKTLRNYPDMRSISRVKSLLSDRNWFVRLNSATTLVNIAPDATYYTDVLEGEDRYAKDILNYAIEQQAVLTN